MKTEKYVVNMWIAGRNYYPSLKTEPTELYLLKIFIVFRQIRYEFQFSFGSKIEQFVASLVFYRFIQKHIFTEHIIIFVFD